MCIVKSVPLAGQIEFDVFQAKWMMIKWRAWMLATVYTKYSGARQPVYVCVYLSYCRGNVSISERQ